MAHNQMICTQTNSWSVNLQTAQLESGTICRLINLHLEQIPNPIFYHILSDIIIIAVLESWPNCELNERKLFCHKLFGDCCWWLLGCLISHKLPASTDQMFNNSLCMSLGTRLRCAVGYLHFLLCSHALLLQPHCSHVSFTTLLKYAEI